jgi:hypothetical protein
MLFQTQVMTSGTRLWDEVYENFEDGDRKVSKLEPNAFLTTEDRLSKVERPRPQHPTPKQTPTYAQTPQLFLAMTLTRVYKPKLPAG